MSTYQALMIAIGLSTLVLGILKLAYEFSQHKQK